MVVAGVLVRGYEWGEEDKEQVFWERVGAGEDLRKGHGGGVAGGCLGVSRHSAVLRVVRMRENPSRMID